MTRPAPPSSRGPKLPKTFRSLDLLRRLNIAAMGLSLAAATSTFFAKLLGSPNADGLAAFATGLPTLLLGLLWAVLLRSRKTVGATKLRWGWVLSIPLAALNGAFACGLMLAGETGELSPSLEKFLVGMFAGATFGVFFWLPALIMTLAFFGLPVAWSQSLAAKGLAGEERGERVLGLASVVLALFAMLGNLWWGHHAEYPSSPLVDAVGNAFLWITPILALAAGALATGLAQAREVRRRRFVDQVEAGHVDGFRVDQAEEGKVLVRVSTVGSAYRVANFEEEVFALDEQGEAREARRAMAPGR